MNSSGHYYPNSKQMLFLKEKPLIGVIGGSGLYELPGMTISENIETRTLYGKPSGPISIGKFCGENIAFLPRHGSKHTIPPHKIPYKANLEALKSLGVRHVIGTCVVGSLRKEIEPGTFVVPDQFINFTWGRDDTFEIDHQFVHLPMAYPYCEHLRNIIVRELKNMKISCRTAGTVVVIQGPRFSTIAESKMYALLGGDIVNMTQYPECCFARELGLCYGAIATVTDYDVGVPSAISMQPEFMKKVLTVFRSNRMILVSFLTKIIGSLKEIVNCNCVANRLAEYYKLANDENT